MHVRRGTNSLGRCQKFGKFKNRNSKAVLYSVYVSIFQSLNDQFIVRVQWHTDYSY